MMPLDHILRKCTGGKIFTKQNKKKYKSLYVHRQQQVVCKKWTKELETQIQIIRIHSQNIRMEFGIKNVAYSL